METMIHDPDEFGSLFIWDLNAAELLSPRARQQDAGTIGVSDLFTCREKVRRIITGAPTTDVPDKTAAIIGTYIHQGALAARKAARPHLLHEVELHITLPNGYVLLGHADEIDPSEPSVTDLKTKAGLALVRRAGADEQMRAQRHAYYLGALQAGLVPSDKGVVRNLFIDREGGDPHPHVEQEPFSMDVVYAAQEWLSDAQYAAEHNEQASKDWPRNMCENWCPFFTSCRGSEDIQEDFLTGHRALVLAEAAAAKERRDEAAAVLAQARADLIGTTGRSDTHWCRTTTVNAKTPYDKFELGPLKETAA
jgi:hypothetical protein